MLYPVIINRHRFIFYRNRNVKKKTIGENKWNDENEF